jgi:hypothetical protein
MRALLGHRDRVPAASRLVSRIESSREMVFASSSNVSKKVPTW